MSKTVCTVYAINVICILCMLVLYIKIYNMCFFLSNRDPSIENLITNITLIVIENQFKPERKAYVCNSICVGYTKFYTDLEACDYQEIPLDLLHTQK